MAKSKYGDLDTLLPGGDTTTRATQRVRRPSPALGAMIGGAKPARVTDSLKAEMQKAEQALVVARQQFDQEKSKLISELEQARASGAAQAAIVLTMPVTKQAVRFELRQLNPELIDVSPENERIQGFLDEISLQDILPSIKKHGQQKPGTVRIKPGGRFELIEGSRRLAAVRLAKQSYIALVGDVPDADVRELCIIENKHQDVSPYEKAKAFQRQIALGEYDNWAQLGAVKGISSSHLSRYKACVELDECFVRILPSPSDMPLSYGELIGQLKRKDEAMLLEKVTELLALRQSALSTEAQLPDVDEVIKLLKSAVRTKTCQPTTRKPILYRSQSGRVSLKHSLTNKGTVKFEFVGVSEDQMEKILVLVGKALHLNYGE